MQQHVGSVFQVEHEGTRPIELRLIRAQKVMESEAARLPRNPFSLHFQGPPEPYLPQRTYQMRHAAFAGPLDLFIVPIGRESAGFIYEAVFT
jgi:hypothetical protein